jgi:hypothetical protein
MIQSGPTIVADTLRNQAGLWENEASVAPTRAPEVLLDQHISRPHSVRQGPEYSLGLGANIKPPIRAILIAIQCCQQTRKQ